MGNVFAVATNRPLAVATLAAMEAVAITLLVKSTAVEWLAEVIAVVPAMHPDRITGKS